MRAACASSAIVAVVLAGCSLDFDRLRKPADGGRDGSADADAPRDAPARDDCGPRAEVCGGGDEDCDGRIDEVMETCTDPICGEGVRTCEAGVLGPCSATAERTVYEVEADATAAEDNPTGRLGDLDVMNLRTGRGLVQFAADIDLSRVGQITVRVHGAMCADDCFPASDCTTSGFRAPGRVELLPLAARFDESTVTRDTMPAEGAQLAWADFDETTSRIDLVATMTGEAADTRAFSLRLIDPVMSVYVARARELLDGDVGCPAEEPATQLIVDSCPPP